MPWRSVRSGVPSHAASYGGWTERGMRWAVAPYPDSYGPTRLLVPGTENADTARSASGPGDAGQEPAGRSAVDRGKQGLKRSGMTDGYGIPLGRVPAGANRHDIPLLAPTLDRLESLGPLPDAVTVQPGRRLRLGHHSGSAQRTGPARTYRAQGGEGARPGESALARRTHSRVAERLSSPRPVLRASRHCL